MTSAMAKKFFIAGGAGFIGYYIVKELLQEGHSVLIYDNFSNFVASESNYCLYLQRRLQDIKDKVEIVRGDVRDKRKLIQTMREFQPEIVINLVAIPLATASNVFFEDAIQINLNGHINILEAMRYSNSVERFIYASTSFVYGNFEYEPADENHPTRPIDIYGGTKLSCEILSKTYSDRYGIDHTIIRPSAVYGPTDANRRVSQIFVENALTGKPLTLNNNGEGKVDFTYVKDTAHGFVLAALSDNAKNQTFNITAGQGRNPKEFVEILKGIIPQEIQTIINPGDDAKRPNRGALGICKAKDLLGYEPQYQLEQGLKEYIDYLLASGLFKK